MSETRMLEQMWPGGIQPKTADPVVKLTDGEIHICCDTKGASIGYLLSATKIEPGLNSGWQVYSGPVNAGDAAFLYVIANRIGYADSEIIKIKL